jgi:hypothetical protein
MDHLPTAVPSRARRRAQRAHARWLALGDWLAGAPLLPAGWLCWVVGPLAAWRVNRLAARCARLDAAGRLAGLAAAHAPAPLTLDITYDTSALERVLARGRLAAHDPAHGPQHDHQHRPADYDGRDRLVYDPDDGRFLGHVHHHDDPPGAV